MKNTIKCLGIIALVAVIGFSMITCGGDDGDSGGKTFLGENLALSGQVWVDTTDFFAVLLTGKLKVTYEKFNGSVDFSTYQVGSGAVTNGQLTYTASPTSSQLAPATYMGAYLEEMYNNVVISNTAVNMYQLGALVVDDADYSYLSKSNSSASGTIASATFTEESVTYIYVDADVKITAAGKTWTEDDDGDVATVTTKNINLSLKKGWNAVYGKTVAKGSMEGNSTATVTMSVSNPDLKWVLEGNDSSSWSLVPPVRKALKSLDK